MGLEMDMDSSQECGFRHGIASHDFVALCQQVFTFHVEGGILAEEVAGAEVPQHEVFGLLGALPVGDDVGVQPFDVLDACGDIPASLGEVGSGIQLVLGGRDNGMLHVYPAVVGIDVPVRIDSVSHIGLKAPVLYLARVDVVGTSVFADGHDEVVAVDVVQVGSIG